MLSVTTLGINSALPAYGRHPTAQVIQFDNLSVMMDCGEGTQMQMMKYKVKRGKLDYIFISHLHGDHYIGLAGLLNTLNLSGRTHDMYLYAPAALEEILLLQFKAANTTLNFPIHFQPLPLSEGFLMSTPTFEVETFLTDHRVECHGFVFREKKNKRSIIPEKAKALGIPYDKYELLQQGADFRLDNGVIIPNEEVTVANSPSKSYAYCADTRYKESIIPFVKNVDMLYHESTYLDDLKEKAFERYHSTSKQAAMIAQKAEVKSLLIGHFSSQYEYLDPFLTEAQSIFPHTQLSKEGETYLL